MPNRSAQAQMALLDIPNAGCELFSSSAAGITRHVTRRDGQVITTTLPEPSSGVALTVAEKYDLAWLRSKKRPEPLGGPCLSLADLFSGCGGLSLGISEAARAVGCDTSFQLAVDLEETFLDTYQTNFAPVRIESKPLETIVDGKLGAAVSETEAALQKSLSSLNVLVAGPPCQGHSDLNNYTRRVDPKNDLYERVARVAELISPEHVVIENVPGVRHDKTRVMQRTVAALQGLGYSVDIADVYGADIGVAQRRQRTFVIASLSKKLEEGGLARTLQELSKPARPVGWAIEDLLTSVGNTPFDQPSAMSEESRRRVDWLFDNGEYDLPDELRPRCHSEKAHTYKSVYGRMHWDRPAQTITTGFQVMGQGRFLHPLQRRVITPHEAARIQFFPDHFDFGTQIRKWYAKMIGNAVPPKMGYAVGLHLLR